MFTRIVQNTDAQHTNADRRNEFTIYFLPNIDAVEVFMLQVRISFIQRVELLFLNEKHETFERKN